MTVVRFESELCVLTFVVLASVFSESFHAKFWLDEMSTAHEKKKVAVLDGENFGESSWARKFFSHQDFLFPVFFSILKLLAGRLDELQNQLDEVSEAPKEENFCWNLCEYELRVAGGRKAFSVLRRNYFMEKFYPINHLVKKKFSGLWHELSESLN